MIKMLFFLMYLLHSIGGHSNSLNEGDLTMKNDADLQAELIPQELNTAYVSGKQDSPWRAIIPINERTRRDAEVASVPETSGISHTVKLYSRIASCISLAVAAIIEIVLYVLEFYT